MFNEGFIYVEINRVGLGNKITVKLMISNYEIVNFYWDENIKENLKTEFD